MTCPHTSTILLNGAAGEPEGEVAVTIIPFYPRRYLCADCGQLFICACEAGQQEGYMRLGLDPTWDRLPSLPGLCGEC